MHDFEQALLAANTAGEDVHLLMTSVMLIIRRVEKRLADFGDGSASGNQLAGASQALTADVERMYAVAVDIGRLALALCEPARRRIDACMPHLSNGATDDARESEFRQAASRIIELFDKTDRTVTHVARLAASSVEALKEAALRCDVPHEVATTTDQLLARLRSPRRSAH